MIKDFSLIFNTNNQATREIVAIHFYNGLFTLVYKAQDHITQSVKCK